MIVIDWHDLISALTHGIWAILAIPAWYLLLQQYKKPRDKLLLSIFMLSMILCYTSSFLFHATAEPWRELFRKCDYACIFILIAGTYTPIMCKYCNLWVVILAWACAFTGIFIQNYTGQAYDFMYLAMGWGLILPAYQLIKKLLNPHFFMITLGAIWYTIGAILEYKQTPCLLNGCIKHHDVFHIFVMLGTTSHYLFFLKDFKKYDRPSLHYKLQSVAS
jgi:hemolysin III